MIITNDHTPVKQTQKATAVTPLPRPQAHDDKEAARRAKIAAMSLAQLNDALFG